MCEHRPAGAGERDESMRLILDSIEKHFGDKQVLKGASFTFEQGRIYGLLGRNGAGKTTTIRHLMGFLKAQQGQCRIDGLDCWRDSDKIQARLGYVPGEISFFGDMTGAEYLRFMEGYRKLGASSRKKELLDWFELDPSGKIKKMSKGMKQKLGLVAAMMHDPEILIFDEPTSGLDPLMQSRFVELVAAEKQKGKTILLSSHMFEEVERTCDRIGIIRAGRLAAVDSVEALRQRHIRRYTVTLDSVQQAAAFAKDFDGQQEGCRVTVATRQSLEEIFMNYYGGRGE